MKPNRLLRSAVVCLAVALSPGAAHAAADEPGDELVALVVNLLGDKDKDVRAIGLEQVRSEAKGPAATRQFAALLPKMPAEAQVGLLSALADRGDGAVRPAVLERLAASHEEPVRVAAIQALGLLGEPGDLATLVRSLASDSKAERAAARASLVSLRGDEVPAAIAVAMQQAPAPVRVALIEILTVRHARETVPAILAAAVDDEPLVRAAAMTALGQLATSEHVGGMVSGVLKAQKGPQREAAEKSVMFVCARIADPEKRAEPLLAALDGLNEADRMALLPTLGRVGGTEALKQIEAAIADPDAVRHQIGLRALCNWPDASIAPRLIELVGSDQHAEHRALALAALIRVAPLPDKRTAAERLELLLAAMSMCSREEEQNLVLKRVRAIRTLEALHFVTPYLDQPAHAQVACETIVEMAHHREFREPNKPEFDLLLDRVIEVSQDATVVERRVGTKKGRPGFARPRRNRSEAWRLSARGYSPRNGTGTRNACCS